MDSGDTRVKAAPKHPLAEVLPRIGNAHITRQNAKRRVCGEHGCSEVEAAAFIRQELRKLTDAMFVKRVPYPDRKTDDQYFLPVDGYERPWFVKIRLEGNQLFVTAFHPQDVP